MVTRATASVAIRCSTNRTPMREPPAPHISPRSENRAVSSCVESFGEGADADEASGHGRTGAAAEPFGAGLVVCLLDVLTVLPELPSRTWPGENRAMPKCLCCWSHQGT